MKVVKSMHDLAIWLLAFYKYLMTFLMIIFLFVLPSVVTRPYFRNSISVDLTVRIILFSYLTFGYWSLANGLINQIRRPNTRYFRWSKNIFSFISFAGSGIIFSSFLWLLTHWSLLTFVPWFPNVAINIIALGNGSIYGILVFSQYCLLPEDK